MQRTRGAIAPPRVYMCLNHVARSSRARGGVTLALRAARHARENAYTHTRRFTRTQTHVRAYVPACASSFQFFGSAAKSKTHQAPKSVNNRTLRGVSLRVWAEPISFQLLPTWLACLLRVPPRVKKINIRECCWKILEHDLGKRIEVIVYLFPFLIRLYS